MSTQLLLQSLFKKCVTDQSLATAALTERHFDTNLQLTPRSRLLLYLLRPFCFWFRLKVRRWVCTFSFQGGIAEELGKGESSENVTIFNNCKSARILFLEDENIVIQLFSYRHRRLQNLDKLEHLFDYIYIRVQYNQII